MANFAPKSPGLFPLVSCGPVATQDLYAVGCVAVGFLPDSLTLTWTDSSNATVAASDAVATYPSVLATGRYTAASRLRLPLSEGKARQPFYCRATHPQGTRVVEVSNPGPSNQPLTLTLHPPSRDDFEGPYRNSTLLCQIRGARHPTDTVRWLKNGVPFQNGVNTENWVAGTLGSYVTNSRVGVTEAEWDAGTTYTCQVGEELRNTSKALECGCKWKVTAVPPLFADIFQAKVAKLTCKVANMPTTEGLGVTWWKENGEELPTKTSPQVLQANGLYSAEGVATVCADDWEKGEVFTCHNAKAPSIYVFPPATEQLSQRELATVTCLAKGFNPPDIFFRWLRNGEPMPEPDYVTFPPIPESQTSASYVTYSVLTVTAQDWGADNIFTCLVGHEQLPLQVAQKSVDKASGKPTAVNVSLVLTDAASACY
uniref:Ig-like domain-containing protein n=1 Tax=Strix occidentalis caurina TaxID=311401 RepID=A0A8D0FJX7_STROC